MTHPCSSSKPPAWCNRKKKRRAGGAKTCKCPTGWKAKGIMCTKGRARKRSSCAA